MTKEEDFEDLVGMTHANIGPLYLETEAPTIPMYSYRFPSSLFWEGFIRGLFKRGLTPKQVIDELQSKGTRWMFDKDGELLCKLGERMANDYDLAVTKIKKKRSSNKKGE